jgi:uncharacterized protein YqfA (UPF0365 family)
MIQKVLDIIIIAFYIFISLVIVLSWLDLYVDVPLNSWWLVMLMAPISVGFYIVKKPKKYRMIPLVVVMTVLFTVQSFKGVAGIKLSVREYENCEISKGYVSSQGGGMFGTIVGYIPTKVPGIRRKMNRDDREILNECISNSVREVTY